MNDNKNESGVENIAPDLAPEQNDATESVMNKKKWLESAFSTGKEEKENLDDDHSSTQQSPVSNELTSDRVKWLREQAFNKSNRKENDQGEKVVPISNELAKDRVRWLQEQAFKKSVSQDETEAGAGAAVVSNELTADRVKWLQEKAFHKNKTGDDGENVPVRSKELTTDRVKWLQEKAFDKSPSKSNGGNGEESVPMRSKELTTDRVKWLQEQAFQKSPPNVNGDEEAVPVSNELTTDRVKWLQDQAFKKAQEQREENEGAPVSNELTTDRVNWLQEQAFKKAHEEGEVDLPVSNELTTDRVKWLQEKAFQQNNTGEEGEEAVPVSNELTTDRVKWLREQAFQKGDQEEGIAVPVSNELTSGRVKILEEQSFQNKQENEVLSPSRAARHHEESLNDDNNSAVSDDDDDDDSNYDSAMEDGESDSEGEGEAEEEEEMPGGDDNDDLYALLAYSKGRIKDRKVEEQDAQDLFNVSNEEEGEAEGSNLEQKLNGSVEDDVLEDDGPSYDSLDERDETNSDMSEDDHIDQEDEKPNKQVDATSANNYGSPLKQNQKKETDELWALLNYSKVRLATGATPTADEAKALGIDQDNEVLAEDSDTDSDPGDDEEFDENEDENDDDSDLNDSYSTDDSAISSGEIGKTATIDKEDLAATRARALAALERTKKVYGDEDDADEMLPQIRTEPKETLTEKQLLKSMVLAEEASKSGNKDFKTQEKLAVLDKVPTPKKEARMRFGRGRGGHSTKRDLGGEFSTFRQKASIFFSETKKKANKAIDQMKETVDKIEKHNTKNNRYYDSSSAGISVRKNDSPFKNFSNNILKVEKMNENKYGDEILYV